MSLIDVHGQETEGVPVITIGNDAEFPCFYSWCSGIASPLCVSSELAAVRMIGDVLLIYLQNVKAFTQFALPTFLSNVFLLCP